MNSIPGASQRPVEDLERALPLIGFFIARQFCTEGYNVLGSCDAVNCDAVKITPTFLNCDRYLVVLFRRNQQGIQAIFKFVSKNASSTCAM